MEDQTEIRRLRRAYQAFVQCAEQVMRATTEPEILRAICESLVDVGGYPLAWVAYAQGDHMVAVARAGLPADQAYVDGLPFSLTDDTLNKGPLGTTFRTGQITVNRDTDGNPDYTAWRQRALDHGFLSSIALPLSSNGTTFGVLSLYARIPDAFDDDERDLLTRLAHAVTFGIETVRTRGTLRETEATLRTVAARSSFEIVEQSPDGWVAINRDWTLVYVNPKASQLFDKPADTLRGSVVWDLFPQHVGTDIEQAMRRTMTAREVVAVERYAARTDEWIACRFYPIDLGLAATFTVITARKRLEQGLQESELRFRQLAESIDDVFWLVDLPHDRILYISPAVEQVWGRRWDDPAPSQQTWLQTVHPEDLARVRDSLPRQMDGDWAIEYRIVRPDGAVRWVHDRCYLVRDGSGRIHRLAGQARDITDQRLLEEQFRQAQKMEAVGQLAGGIAHDFNNLLTVIVSYAGLAMGELAADDPLANDLTEIHQAGERAAELTRQLLAFSRRQVIQPRSLDLNRELASLRAMLARLVEEHVTLVLVTTPEAARVYADPGQIAQVVMNLAVNARDAMPAGGTLTLETSIETLDAATLLARPDAVPGPYVVLTARDTGIGMDEVTREKIFEPFFTTKEVGRGTGLGLSTVFGIVRQNHGHITVDSEPGKGSTFRIYLPMTDQPTVPVVPGRSDRASPGLSGQETLLLVEDSDAVRRLMHAVLRRHGYEILQAQDGEEALRVSAQHGGTIDLLVTDVMMPGIGGRELARRLAPLRPAMRVLYVSGYDAQSVVLDPGVTLLQKPVRPQTLLEKVREILDTRTP